MTRFALSVNVFAAVFATVFCVAILPIARAVLVAAGFPHGHRDANKLRKVGRVFQLALLLASAQAVCGPRDPAENIGTATITADRTIVLSLRSQDDAGMIAEGLFNYAPGDPNYIVVLRHIGAISPGETVWVRPFPDERREQEARPR